jgi:hypothetical protein
VWSLIHERKDKAFRMANEPGKHGFVVEFELDRR